MTHHDRPHRHITILPVAAALALTFAAGAAGAETAGAPACAISGDASVAALSQDWILVGWERKAGDGLLDFRQKLGNYYDWSSPDVVLTTTSTLGTGSCAARPPMARSGSRGSPP